MLGPKIVCFPQAVACHVAWAQNIARIVRVT